MYVLLYLPPEPTPPRGHRGLKSSGPCRSSPWCPCRRPPSSSIAFRELDHAAFIDRTRTILVDPAVRGREAGMNAPGVRRRAAPQGAARGLPGIEDLYRYTKDVGAGYGTEDFSFFLYALVKVHKPGRVLALGTGPGETGSASCREGECAYVSI